MKILYFLNSSFGISNTIGARPHHIAKKLKEKNSDPLIFCRDYNKKYSSKFKIMQVLPLGRLIMGGFTAFFIYISKRKSIIELKNSIFEFFLIKKLKKINLKEIDMVHSWDFLPKTYKFIKNKNQNIKIIQDVAMAFPNVIEQLKDKNKIWKNESIELHKFVKDSLEYIDLFVTPSNFTKKSLIKERINEKKIVIVPFGVDINKFRPLKNKMYNDCFKAAFVGSVNNRKGIGYLVGAWKELNLKNAELNIYGRIYPESLNHLNNIKKYNIILHGFKKISEELPKNHIYVFPSLLEGSSKSIYEALACGLPVITTPNSGSIVRNNIEGFIIPAQEKNSIKEKINFFYKNRKKIKKFGKKSRKLAKKYTWDDYANKIITLYKPFKHRI